MDTYSLGWWNPLSVTNEKSSFCGGRRNGFSPSALHCSEWPSLSSLGGRECGVYVSEKEVVGTSGPGRVDKLDVAVVGGVLWRRATPKAGGWVRRSLQQHSGAIYRNSLTVTPEINAGIRQEFAFSFSFIFFSSYFLFYYFFNVWPFGLCCFSCFIFCSLPSPSLLRSVEFSQEHVVVDARVDSSSGDCHLTFHDQVVTTFSYFSKQNFLSKTSWNCGQHLCWWHSPSSHEWLHYRGTHQGPMVIVAWFSFLVGEPWTCLWW